MDATRTLLRHTVATVAYRGGKAIRGVPLSFATFDPGSSSRTPVQILAHVGDLFEWALSIAKGGATWIDHKPESWEREVARFFEVLERFDAYLASDALLAVPSGQLFQGPIADALTHIGQIMLLRRLSGCPTRGESFFAAEITTGRVGADQSPPRREFD